MNVLITAVSHATGISGVQRHALNLVRSLQSSPRIEEVHVVIGAWQDAMREQLEQSQCTQLHVHTANAERNSISRNAWHYWVLPDLAERLLVDVLHLTYPVPVNSRALFVPAVLTLHDLYAYQVPANFGFPRVLVNRCMLRQCLHAVDGIACVSAYTEQQLARYMKPAVVEKAVRIPNCVEPEGRPDEVFGLQALSHKPFLLCVAQHRRNKNLLFALRVFARLKKERQVDPQMSFVILGMAGPETRTLIRLIASLELEGSVKLFEGVTNDQLAWYYVHCDAVLAPSVTEGFGLPVAEALIAGSRVVCSDIPAFREFGAGHCRFVPLEDPSPEERFADAVLRSLREPKPRPVTFAQLTRNAIGTQYASWYEAVVNRRHLRAAQGSVEQATPAAAERQLL